MVRRESEAGASLPEVLLVMVLLAVVLTGALGAHWHARGLQQGAWQRQQVVLLLEDLGERMRLNPPGHDTYLDALRAPMPSEPAAHACVLEACAPAARAQADIGQFAAQLRRVSQHTAWAVEPCADVQADCLLVAWAGTQPVRGMGADACLDGQGRARAGAACVALALP